MKTLSFITINVLICSCATPPPLRLRDLELGHRALHHGRLAEADVPLTRALRLAEAPGQDPYNLASVYNALGDYSSLLSNPSRAETYYRKALSIQEKILPAESVELTTTLGYLAEVCAAQGKLIESEKLLRRILSAIERIPSRYSETAARLGDLATIQRGLGRDDQAAAAYRQAIEVTQNALGHDSRQVGDRLTDLALFEHARGHLSDAEPLYRRALSIKEKRLGPGHAEVINAYNDFALFEESQGKFSQADALYQYALEQGERVHGKDSPVLSNTLNNYAHLLRRLGHTKQATKLEDRAKMIAEKKPTKKSK